MKAKWAILTKIQLTGFFGINKLRHTDDDKAKKRAAGAVIALCAVGVLFYIVAISVAFVRQGVTDSLPPFMTAVASVLIFAFSLVRGCSLLFAAKDYDAVMCLPVSKRAVIVSRLIGSYLVNLIFAVAVMLPSSAVYFWATGFSLSDFAVIFFAMLFAPLLPLAVATGIGTLITAVTAKFKSKALLQTLLAVLFLVAVFAVSFAVSFNIDENAADMNAVASLMTGKIYPPALLIGMALKGVAWALPVYIAASAAAAALLIVLTAPFYAAINARLSAKHTGGIFKTKQLRRTPVFSALLKKEFRRLISSAAYAVNSLSGTILLLLAAVAFLIFDPLRLLSEAAGGALPVSDLVYPCGAICLLFAGMTFPSASALSLEGKSHWIMCSLPLPASAVLLSKALPGFLFCAPVSLFFSAVACCQAGADAAAWVCVLLAPVAFCAFVSMFGVWLNYKFPKYDWTNETAAVKNNIPSLILALGGLVPEIAIVTASFFLGKYGFILFFSVAALSAAGCAVLWAKFKKARLFDAATENKKPEC